MWAGYTSVLGFLMVFRNNQAYTRFWEGLKSHASAIFRWHSPLKEKEKRGPLQRRSTASARSDCALATCCMADIGQIGSGRKLGGLPRAKGKFSAGKISQAHTTDVSFMLRRLNS